MITSDVPAITLQNAAEYMDVISDLLDTPVCITELVSGSPWSVVASRSPRWDVEQYAVLDLSGDGETVTDAEIDALYGQRLDYMLLDMLRNTTDAVETITLRGVMVSEEPGAGQPFVRLFDIEINGTPMDAQHVYAVFGAYGVAAVPVLTPSNMTLSRWLARRSLHEAAIGPSRLSDTPREGIVIRPFEEMTHEAIGRLILKFKAGQ